MSSQLYPPVVLTPGKCSRYPLNRMLTWLSMTVWDPLETWQPCCPLLEIKVQLQIKVQFLTDKPRTEFRSSYNFLLSDFRGIWYLRGFRKYFEKIQVSLKSDENKGYFTWRPIWIFFIISRSFLLLMSDASDEICRENQNSHFVLGNFLSKVVPFIS
jgi:hypothetical protein